MVWWAYPRVSRDRRQRGYWRTHCGQMEEKGSDKDNSRICAGPFPSQSGRCGITRKQSIGHTSLWTRCHFKQPFWKLLWEECSSAVNTWYQPVWVSRTLSHSTPLLSHKYTISACSRFSTIAPLTQKHSILWPPVVMMLTHWPSVIRATGGLFQPSHKVCVR